ncbi:hypothetical protein UCDDA912_g08236 [Diaporthe ampelina]|uniref:Uncharacterized protein n=1 Tax=Diaporthe ampelina TaxID=1214573 RepID=A0A0G2FCD2_9PEZI|nr:hypothetical protein UCDDA912_g08236 [Diaporthe ampelina]
MTSVAKLLCRTREAAKHLSQFDLRVTTRAVNDCSLMTNVDNISLTMRIDNASDVCTRESVGWIRSRRLNQRLLGSNRIIVRFISHAMSPGNTKILTGIVRRIRVEEFDQSPWNSNVLFPNDNVIQMKVESVDKATVVIEVTISLTVPETKGWIILDKVLGGLNDRNVGFRPLIDVTQKSENVQADSIPNNTSNDDEYPYLDEFTGHG